MDIAEIRARKKPNTRRVPVLLEPDLRVRLDETDVERRRLTRLLAATEKADDRLNRRAEAPAVVEQIEELDIRVDEIKDEIDEATAWFLLRALPRKAFHKLVADCPPTPDDEEDGLDFNAELLAPELLARSAVDPEMTVGDAEAIFDEWDDGIAERLFVAAFQLNKEVRDVPFDNYNLERTRNSERTSEPLELIESDTPSS